MKAIPIATTTATTSQDVTARDDIEYADLETNRVRTRRKNVMVGLGLALALAVVTFFIFTASSSTSKETTDPAEEDHDSMIMTGDHTKGKSPSTTTTSLDEPTPQPTFVKKAPYAAEKRLAVEAVLASFSRNQGNDEHRSILHDALMKRDHLVIGAIGSSVVTSACETELTYLEILVDKLNAVFNGKPKFSLQKQAYDAWCGVSPNTALTCALSAMPEVDILHYVFPYDVPFLTPSLMKRLAREIPTEVIEMRDCETDEFQSAFNEQFPQSVDMMCFEKALRGAIKHYAKSDRNHRWGVVFDDAKWGGIAWKNWNPGPLGHEILAEAFFQRYSAILRPRSWHEPWLRRRSLHRRSPASALDRALASSSANPLEARCISFHTPSFAVGDERTSEGTWTFPAIQSSTGFVAVESPQLAAMREVASCPSAAGHPSQFKQQCGYREASTSGAVLELDVSTPSSTATTTAYEVFICCCCNDRCVGDLFHTMEVSVEGNPMKLDAARTDERVGGECGSFGRVEAGKTKILRIETKANPPVPLRISRVVLLPM